MLVTIDTLRADSVGFAGNREVATPLLDRLAAAGRVFPETRAHNVVTLPSHANLLTGLYPFQHGVRDNSGFVLDAALPTLATLLEGAGYATGAFVGAFPLDSRYGLAHGFDLYDDGYRVGSEGSSFTIAERRGDEVVAAARAWWTSATGKPRLLWVHLYDPHASYAPPEPFASRYRERPYLGEIAAVDSFLAPILAPQLDGQEPPALVVVTSDHGEALGDHGELTHGLFAYEATLRVPLVVWGAGVAPGTDARAARHVDILPTILARAGVEAPRRLPGHSLLESPVSGDSYFEAFSTALNRGWAPLRGLVRGGRKMIDLPIPELYDLVSDPRERTNLAPRAQGETATLRDAIPRESAFPPERSEVSSEEAKKLQSLGYAVGSAAPKSSYGPEDDPKSLLPIDRQLHEVVDLFSRGRFEESVAVAKKVIAARPESPEAYDHMALALRELERHDEAIAVLRNGLAKAAVKESIARQLGMALSEVGRPAEAVAVLEPLAAQEEPNGDPETMRVLASALADAGQPERALPLLERALALAPNDPRLLEAIGTAELRRDRPAEARVWLERALAENDRLATAWNTLGVALFNLEGPKAAIPAWQKALAADPTLWDALYNLGLVAASAGEREIAVGALRRFAAEAPPARYAPDIAKARAVLKELGA